MSKIANDKALKADPKPADAEPKARHYPVELKANGSPKTPHDDPKSTRPTVTLKDVKCFRKDDAEDGLPERECTAAKEHDAHEWTSGLMNHKAWCYGTGVSPTWHSTATSYSYPKKTDYTVPLVVDGEEKPWRTDYTVPITVEEARRIAYHMHRNDTDKSGDSYHLHLEGVRLGVVVLGGDEEEQIAALFHDAVEDNHTTYDMLEKIGCTERTINMVKDVEKGLGEAQEVYLARIIEGGPGSMRVKLADLLHNTRHDRMEKVKKSKGEHTHARLLKKYRPSIARLLMELKIIATEDDQKLLDKVATKPVGSSTSYSSGNYNSADGSTKYKGNNLTKNEWPAGWPSPIKEKVKSYSNKYLLWDGTEKITHGDKFYKVWSKTKVESEQKKPGKKDWTPAQETEVLSDTNANYSSGTTTTKTASGQGKSKQYDIDQLFRGDWVTFWRAPILTRLSLTDKTVSYLLANGEVKEETLKYGYAATSNVRTVSVWTQNVWEHDPGIQPFDTTDEDIMEYLIAIENPYKGEVLDADVLDDVDRALGEFVADGSSFRHEDGRECVDEYGMWWYRNEGDKVWIECEREHASADAGDDEEGEDVTEDDYVPACGNVAPHDQHFVQAGTGSASMEVCAGKHSVSGIGEPKCLNEESHAAHWMLYGPGGASKKVCAGVGTHMSSAREREKALTICGRTDPHGVHWIEQDQNDPHKDVRCPGISRGEALKAQEAATKSSEQYEGYSGLS